MKDLRTPADISVTVGTHLRRLMQVDDAQVVRSWIERLTAGERTERLMSRRLLAKRFRGSSLDQCIADRVVNVTAYAVRKGLPLKLLIPCGGYKSPASQEHPDAGWAELFAVAGMCELVSPICAVHAPGVVVEFSSDEIVVPLFTGARTEVLDSYRQRFDRILDVVGRGQRPNLQLRQSLLRSHYDVDNLLHRIQDLGRRLEDTWFPALPDQERARLMRAAANNRFTPLPKGSEARTAMLRRSVCDHQAFLTIDNEYRADILFASATVPVALRRGLDGWLHLGSNRRSATQFWVGAGLLDLTVPAPKAHILPPGRAAQLWPRTVRVAAGAIGIEGFDTVPVLVNDIPTITTSAV